MSDERIERGAGVYDKVYAGMLPAVPPGAMAFTDVMYAQLFDEHWSRPQLGFRERRLLTLATIAAGGDTGTWGIHLEAALRNGELTATEAREVAIHLTQYLGYPRVAGMAGKTEEVVGKLTKEGVITQE